MRLLKGRPERENLLQKNLLVDFNGLAALLAQEGLTGYFPHTYSQGSVPSNKSGTNNKFYMVHDPLIDVDTHHGCEFEVGSEGYQFVERIDEEFIENYPTYL